jgi:DNA-binding response OmpR family regulator
MEEMYLKTPAILIAIEDEVLQNTLVAHLRQEGYQTLSARDGETAWHLAKLRPLLLVLLDLTLPGRDGLEICRLLRSQPDTAYLPVLLIASHDDEMETIVGLEVGADDYVTIPMRWNILRARIRALLRRSKYMQETSLALEEAGEKMSSLQGYEYCLVIGDLHIDLAGRVVRQRGQPVELSTRLFDLLLYLVHHDMKASYFHAKT